ncbi:hypothetical protein ABZ341_27670 [Streptomyces sp. NPDC006173]|uniref:hypothetical protein n=1 Tax=Streptomyces sp. NPDC006173 TaxID=3155349 RepID=UPI0033D0E313
MAKAPEGYHTVRRHIRRNPGTGGRKLSGWTIAALIAAVWLWSQLIGFGEATPAKGDTPQPSISASAGR